MDLRLDIFPQGSLASSVITTVWVGVWVVAFFNLRLGWVFSGLVVPGYLVPLLLVKPLCVLTLGVEGVVTYLIVRAVSDHLPLPSWCSLFGRDRYFALLFTSIPVRLAFDDWLLIRLGEWVNHRYGLEFDYSNNLLGFGLVIVPLIANQFWKTGLVRGLPSQVVTVGITYGLVRYGLMNFTNFSIGNLQYVYEELAADLLSSPKAYILSLTTAYWASRMNQKYAWEYHGIHIPALLAIEWYEPIKVLSTFAEAAVVYVLASAALRAPLIRRTSFEGAQKALFFFNIAFLYKLAMGHAMLAYAPDVKVTDYFGFGYMISTLMALKSHDKGIPLRLARGVLQVSATGAIVASLIGFGLTFVPKGWLGSRPAGVDAPAALPDGRLIDVLRADRVGLYATTGPGAEEVPDGLERDTFARALRQLVAYGRHRDPDRLAEARRLLGEVRYELHQLPGGYLYLRERPPQRGWGMYVLDPAHAGGPAVEVPAALDEWATLEAGAHLFERWHGRALAVAGGGRRARGMPGRPATADTRSFFHVFHAVVGRRDALQVRGYTAENVRPLTGHRPSGDHEPQGVASALWVHTAVPPGAKLDDLRSLVGPFDVNWSPAPLRNVQRDAAAGEFAELFLTRKDRRAILARSVLDPGADRPAGELRSAEGSIRDWLFARRAELAAPGSELYVPAAQEELLYLDEEVIAPIVRAVRSRGPAPSWSDAERDRLHAAAAAAAVFRYHVTLFKDAGTGTDYVILSEPEADPRRRYWGTYAFRAGGAEPYVVQVPMPVYEMNSFEFGVELFERRRAAAFCVPGAHPEANRNRSADFSRVQNRVNLFNLVGQVVVRETGREPLMVVQARTFGLQPTGLFPGADVVLATDNGAPTRETLTPLGESLLRALESDRLTVRLADGGPDVAGYGVGGTVQAGYLSQSENKEFALAWVSPLARVNYRQLTDTQLLQGHFAALNVPTVERSLFDHLRDLGDHPKATTLPPKVRELLERYADTADVVALHAAVTADPALRFERVADPDAQQSFLLVQAAGRMPVVINVGAKPAKPAAVVRAPRLDRAAVAEFVRTRATWLEIGGAP